MTKKKRIGRFIVSSLLGLFLFSSFVLIASAVSSNFDCSYAGKSCKGVDFSAYGTSHGYSDTVYATKGQALAVSNESSGPFNLVTQLVDFQLFPVSGEIAFTDTQFIKVPKDGNYRILVTCKDSSDKKRCTGRGTLSQ